MPPYELAIECTQATRGMSDAHCHSSMLRFHLDFIHVLKYLLHEGLHGNIFSMNGKCSDVYVFVCIARWRTIRWWTRPSPFSISEVSAGPEDAWKLIHRLSWRPYCEASLHTQISWNIREWIQSFCQSWIWTGSNSSGWFPDYIHKQQVNLFCSLAEQTQKYAEQYAHAHKDKITHACCHAVADKHSLEFCGHLFYASFCLLHDVPLCDVLQGKGNLKEKHEWSICKNVPNKRIIMLCCVVSVFQLDLSCCRLSVLFFIFVTSSVLLTLNIFPFKTFNL